MGLSGAGLAGLANLSCVDQPTLFPMSQSQLVPALLAHLPPLLLAWSGPFSIHFCYFFFKLTP